MQQSQDSRMRGRGGLGLALALGLAIAAPAASQQPAAKTPPSPPPPAQASLPPPRPLGPSAAQQADQCRTACAQAYYFCLAGDAAETCPDAWSQCRLACAPPSGGQSIWTQPTRP